MSRSSSDGGSEDEVPYAERPEWADVEPLHYVEGAVPVVAIQYTAEHKDALAYFRAVLLKVGWCCCDVLPSAGLGVVVEMCCNAAGALGVEGNCWVLECLAARGIPVIRHPQLGSMAKCQLRWLVACLQRYAQHQLHPLCCICMRPWPRHDRGDKSDMPLTSNSSGSAVQPDGDAFSDSNAL